MHSHPYLSNVITAVAAAFLVAAIVHAAPLSDTQPGEAIAAASQTALAIAGVAAMKPAIVLGPSAQPAEAEPVGTTIVAPAAAISVGPARPVPGPMTAEQRHQLMMLLIMRDTSRNPFSALH